MLDISELHDHWRVLKIGQSPNSATYVEQWRRKFATFDDLPIKTQEGVAVLSMCKDAECLPGLGQRVNHGTFWLDDEPGLLNEYVEEREKKDDTNTP